MADGLDFDFTLPASEPAQVGSAPEAAASDDVLQPAPVSGPARVRRRGAGGGRKAGTRFVSVGLDGAVNWDALDPEQAARAKAALLASEKGGAAPVIEFTPEECAYLYSILGEVEATLAARVGKCPRELARKLWLYSPEEVATLAPATSRVLTKHGGAFLTKWHDEFVLTLALAAIHQRKLIDFSRELQEFRVVEQRKARPIRPEQLADLPSASETPA